MHATLRSLVDNAWGRMEIVVSDNASADNTAEVVSSYRQTFPRIKYFRWPENMGADRNYLKALELAEGKFCWLFGSDDVVIPGAIKDVSAHLQDECQIYLFNRVVCSRELQPIRRQSWLSAPGTRTFTFGNDHDIEAYLRLLTSLGGLFSYLSCIVVRRSAWNSVRYDEAFTGTAYSHAFILMSLLRDGCTLKCVDFCPVYCRSGNDAFDDGCAAKRALLDVIGYRLLGQRVFAHSEGVQREISRLIRRERPWRQLPGIAFRSDDAAWQNLKGELRRVGYSPFLTGAAGLLGKSHRLFRIARTIKRTLAKAIP